MKFLVCSLAGLAVLCAACTSPAKTSGQAPSIQRVTVTPSSTHPEKNKAPARVTSTVNVVVVTKTVVPPKPAGPTHDCKVLFATGYTWDQMVQYWQNLGRPADMDDDANGSPCETVYGRAFQAASLECKVTSVSAFDLEFEVMPGVSPYSGTAIVTFYERSVGITFPTTAVVTVEPAGSIANWHSVPPEDIGASAEPDSCTAVASG